MERPTSRSINDDTVARNGEGPRKGGTSAYRGRIALPGIDLHGSSPTSEASQ